jgi:hypothetical protein
MKKIKTILIITMFILTGLGLTPLISSNEIIEKTQSSNALITSTSEIDDTKTDLITEEELNFLKDYLSEIFPLEKTSGTTFDDIINIIKNILSRNPALKRSALVISQGWSYNINFFKNTKLQIKKDLFQFWQYIQASKRGKESKTLVIKSNEPISSRTVGLYSGTQIGLMFRPLGVYCFQKNTFPILSYTLFIGFATYVFINAQEEIQIPLLFSSP